MNVSLTLKTKCQIIDIVAEELSRVILKRNVSGNLEVIEADWPEVAVTVISKDTGKEITECRFKVLFSPSSETSYVKAVLEGFVSMLEIENGRIEFEDLDISTCREAISKHVVIDYLNNLMYEVVERKMEDLAKEHHDLGVFMNKRFLG